MAKDSEIVLVEAAEIMDALPVAMRHDDEIMDVVIASLQTGVSKHEVRLDALEIAQLKTQEAMAHGFNLVNNEIQGIKQDAREDRIHASYAKQAAEKAQAIAEQAWSKTQEVAIQVVRAEEKAEGAKELAKQSNKGWLPTVDPILGMIAGSVLILFVMATFARVQKVETVPQSERSVINCGVDVTCNYQGSPDVRPVRRTNGGV
jgi:flagellar motor protein MotB